jgi:hypothetical protein
MSKSVQEEKKTGLSHEEIAEELQAAAGDFARGQVRIGHHTVTVGEPVYLKMKQKVKGDMAYFTLSVKMPVAEAARKTSEKPLSRAVEQKMPPRSQTEAGYGGKKLKKEIGRLWKSVAKQIEARQMPDAAETAGLQERCEEFNLFADREWQEEWADCTLAVEKCFIDAAAGDWPAARAGVTLVDRMIRACHAKYKI